MTIEIECSICHNPFIPSKYFTQITCSRRCSAIHRGNILREQAKKLRDQKIIDYNKNPNYCQNPKCNNVLTFKKRNQPYCSHPCAATITNSNRLHTIETKLKISKSLNKRYIKPKKIKVCPVCHSLHIKSSKSCSKACYDILNQRSGRKGGLKSASLHNRRSKNEIALYDLCKSTFNNVTHNDPIFDGWDADILLHDQKIAILWNGVWHYQEMSFTKQSLLQVQTRDAHKAKLIKKYGWKLFIVKDTDAHPTKPEQAFANLKQEFNL